jgi:hypothetical protein
MRARRVASLASVVALFGSAAAVAACSTILGFEDVTLGDTDGGVGGDATNGDGPTNDSPTHNDGPTNDSPQGADTGPDGPCGDTTMDPLNCGRCGHSCLKGTCMAGVCQPFVLSTGYFGTRDLAVDATNVYFTNTDANTIFRTNKLDGTNTVKIADQPDAYVPFAIAVDATSVYWTNHVSVSGEIRKCPLVGCNGSPSTLIATVDYPSSILLLGSNIVWAANGSGAVAGSALDGTNPFTVFAAGSGASPYLMASDTSYIYFTDNGNGVTQRVPLDGGAGTPLSNNGYAESYGVGVVGGNVYFSGGSINDGVLWRIPSNQFVDGGNATAFASSQKQPIGVAVDGSYVYWVNTGDINGSNGSVMACPLTTVCSTPIVLATGQIYPLRIAVDADAVYWANNGLTNTATDGSIWKVAKP